MSHFYCFAEAAMRSIISLSAIMPSIAAHAEVATLSVIRQSVIILSVTSSVVN